MAKYTNAKLANLVAESTEIDNDAKAQIIKMLRESKTYGLVWERNPEDAKEILKDKLLVFHEDKEKYVAPNGQSGPNHILIEGDNLHVLSTLCYTHEGKVDVIYIDPPYNSGATDWKYNNNYVDDNDAYRHSKWLSMMENRLLIAKKLLNPVNSVLIVTIDEKEYLHLGCLLEDLFPNTRIQMVSSVINTAGATRQNEFSRTDEYLFFVYIGECKPQPLLLDREWLIGKSSNQGKITWDSLKRAGTQNKRVDSPGCFYPIFVSEDGAKIVEIGDAIDLSVNRRSISVPPGCVAIWPLHDGDVEGRWQTTPSNLRELHKKGFVKLGKFTGESTMAVSYLKRGEQQKVESGFYKIIGHRTDGSIIVDDDIKDAPFLPGTQWNIPSHNAKQNGTILLNDIIGKDKFTFPKSLYAVHDALRFFVADKPDAIILDFFAGSGTTMHATMMLNDADGGRRQCILVTNNESNICEDVTYIRNKKVIEGYRSLKGKQVEGYNDNQLHFFRSELIDRAQDHQNKKRICKSLTGVICVKENCFSEHSSFGRLNLNGKQDIVRYFEESDRKVLLVYDTRAIPFVVNEIKGIQKSTSTIKVYVFADGSYPYTEDFKDVLDKADLIPMPGAMLKALKYILPQPDDRVLDKLDLTEIEIEDELNEAERIEEGRLL